jgi:hypothetical protein
VWAQREQLDGAATERVGQGGIIGGRVGDGAHVQAVALICTMRFFFAGLIPGAIETVAVRTG